MIISASRRTDIPAWFSTWFMNRVREGFVWVRSPFKPGQIRRYSLRPEDVDVIVFWSKNPKPLMDYLDELDEAGYRYYFQFTLNDYPSVLEPNLPPLEERLETFKALSRRVGPSRVVWRWDPIVISSLTPVEHHLEHFEKVADALQGYSERVAISLLDFYGKVAARLQRLTKEAVITFRYITDDAFRGELLDLVGGIRSIAVQRGFHIYSCAETVDLACVGVPRGACIDADLIGRLLGTRYEGRKDNGQRAQCLCTESVDIGAYNTCRHKCVYCYANSPHDESVDQNCKNHVPTSPLLVGKCDTGQPGLRHEGGRTSHSASTLVPRSGTCRGTAR